jgi:hypothetical protein
LYLGLPVIGVSSPGNTAYRSSQDFTATASQTTFTTTGSYTVGFLEVYRNGARLGDADFTATNGTTVVLGTACNAGDIVTIVFFTLVSIANAMPQSGGTFTGNIAVPTGTLYPLVSDTAKSATGTSVDFTGIPATAKRITVMFSGVSTNGTSALLAQIGDSGGIETTGYISGTGIVANNAVGSLVTSTAGILLSSSFTAANTFHGSITFNLLGLNIFSASGSTYQAALGSYIVAGSKTLSDTLTQVRITTVNGTDTFDAGTINIMWE